MSKPPWWAPKPAAVISVLIIGLFTVAYLRNPSDQTLVGALIAAFSAAWGYYLGSSKGAAENRETLNHLARKADE